MVAGRGEEEQRDSACPQVDSCCGGLNPVVDKLYKISNMKKL